MPCRGEPPRPIVRQVGNPLAVGERPVARLGDCDSCILAAVLLGRWVRVEFDNLPCRCCRCCRVCYPHGWRGEEEAATDEEPAKRSKPAVPSHAGSAAASDKNVRAEPTQQVRTLIFARRNLPRMTTLPGPTLGVVGGGQLGRMLAEAAAPLGVEVIVLDPTPECPASLVAREQIVGAFDDPEAVRELAAVSDVLTFEIELADPDLLEEVADEYDGFWVAGELSWCFHTDLPYDHVVDFEADFDAACPDLPVTALCRDVRDLQVEPESHHMVVSTTVLGHIERPELPDLCRRIVRWLKPAGLLFAEEFSTADPESLETILSSNVNLDSLLENVNDEIEFP